MFCVVLLSKEINVRLTVKNAIERMRVVKHPKRRAGVLRYPLRARLARARLHQQICVCLPGCRRNRVRCRRRNSYNSMDFM